MEKTCTLCEVTKPIHEFHRDAKNSDGHCHRCAECKNAGKRKKDPYQEYNGKPKSIVNPIVNKATENSTFTKSEQRRLHTKSSKGQIDFNVPLEKVSHKVSVEAEGEGGNLNMICDSILERHDNNCFNISIWKDHCTCTIHGSPQRVYKAKTPDELLSKVLS